MTPGAERARKDSASRSAALRLPWIAPGQRRAAAPASEAELLERARWLAGCTLAELATCFGVALPESSTRAKGLAGGLAERALGATARSASEPDFVALGIELKTIPLDARGKPRESTFVCTAQLRELACAEWDASPVRRKLARVLWVPVEGSEVALPARRIGSARLWQPSCEQLADLRADFEALAGAIASGGPEALTAHAGRYLQVRPKAANSRVRGRGTDEHGAPLWTLPRGFYLRPTFTAAIFA